MTGQAMVALRSMPATRRSRIEIDPGGLQLRLGRFAITFRVVARQIAPRPHRPLPGPGSGAASLRARYACTDRV